MAELVKNINRDAAGVTAILNTNGSITLSNDTGVVIDVGGTTTNTGLTFGTYQGYLSLSNSDNSNIAVTATGGASASLNFWGFNASTGAASVTGGVVGVTNLVAGDLLINGVDVGASTGSSAADKASAINSVNAKTGVTAKATTTSAFALDFTKVTIATASNITINGTGVNLSTKTDLAGVVTAINGTVQGVVASANTQGQLVLTSASGLDISIADGAAFMGGASTTHGTIALTSDKGADIKIAGASTAGIAKAGFTAQGGSSDAIGSGLSVGSLANANNAIDRIDAAINMISKNRSELGAVQNRLDSTISNLQNVSVNLSAANGRIMDADFAKETADMTKSQILMQAGVAMLAQSKQLPQSVLELLK